LAKQYIKTNNSAGYTGHNLLLALPLSVVTVFCLGFIFMQPSIQPRDHSSTGSVSNQGSKATQVESSSSANLPKLEALNPTDEKSTPNTTPPSQQPKPISTSTSQPPTQTPKAVPTTPAPATTPSPNKQSNDKNGLLRLPALPSSLPGL
jgi:cytoskeletal protein RodZ